MASTNSKSPVTLIPAMIQRSPSATPAKSRCASRAGGTAPCFFTWAFFGG
jgi:hypothetical protein